MLILTLCYSYHDLIVSYSTFTCCRMVKMSSASVLYLKSSRSSISFFHVAGVLASPLSHCWNMSWQQTQYPWILFSALIRSRVIPVSSNSFHLGAIILMISTFFVPSGDLSTLSSAIVGAVSKYPICKYRRGQYSCAVFLAPSQSMYIYSIYEINCSDDLCHFIHWVSCCVERPKLWHFMVIFDKHAWRIVIYFGKVSNTVKLYHLPLESAVCESWPSLCSSGTSKYSVWQEEWNLE